MPPPRLAPKEQRAIQSILARLSKSRRDIEAVDQAYLELRAIPLPDRQAAQLLRDFQKPKKKKAAWLPPL